MTRIVVQYSCGAASAVAAKLAIAEHGDSVQIVNAFIREEHEDNRRFLTNCEQWFDKPVTVIGSAKYDYSTVNVFRRERFLKGPGGAPCSKMLKRRPLDAWREPDDVMVLGFTAEEEDRLIDIQERLPDVTILAPLIDQGLAKADCLAIVERAGIELPAMYRLGYNNANCIGCIKGGKGYWNKVRRDFPNVFETIAAVQDELGPGSYLWADDNDPGRRISLRELDPKAGRHSEILPSCSFFCELAEGSIDAAQGTPEG